MTAAALGFRAHSGWAAVVAVTGPGRSPVVIDRRRIELADPKIPGSKQPFHEAEGLPLKQAEKLVGRCFQSTRRLAREALGSALTALRKEGHEVVGCGVLLGSGRALPALDKILASHALLHAAEGEMFRAALVEAAEHSGLPVTGVRERELSERAAAALRLSPDELKLRVAEIGRGLGPPWRQDQKMAVLAGWMALTAGSRAPRGG